MPLAAMIVKPAWSVGLCIVGLCIWLQWGLGCRGLIGGGGTIVSAISNGRFSNYNYCIQPSYKVHTRKGGVAEPECGLSILCEVPLVTYNPLAGLVLPPHEGETGCIGTAISKSDGAMVQWRWCNDGNAEGEGEREGGN